MNLGKAHTLSLPSSHYKVTNAHLTRIPGARTGKVHQRETDLLTQNQQVEDTKETQLGSSKLTECRPTCFSRPQGGATRQHTGTYSTEGQANTSKDILIKAVKS